ncbi:MAG: hypothetical protein JO052_00975 [Bradyrhizobium sp.]|nr:hypothetical protein [Bradyrhizobium sp.]
MSLFEDPATSALRNQLRQANAVTPQLISDVIDLACPRFPSQGRAASTARIERLIAARAWTDVALALVALELPFCQIRRLAYDGGEWHCALSRQRELPDWLDQAVEASHADLILALLCAFVDAQVVGEPPSQPSVPTLTRKLKVLYDTVCCDDFA